MTVTEFKTTVEETLQELKAPPKGDYPDVMIDLETVSEKTNAAFTEVGLVRFDRRTGDIGLCAVFYVDLQDAFDHGLMPSGSTIKWWLAQSEDARQAFLKGQSNALPLRKVLSLIASFLNDVKGTRVWGNGARFDLGVMANAYERLRLDIPWAFYREFDVRTVVDLGRDIGFDPKRDMPFVGIAHTSLDDCFHQIKYITEIRKRLLDGRAT